MCNTPSVSVVVLIYNVEQHIEKCVESLFNQTLDSIEYIFVDDYSTDSSLIKLNNVLKKYPLRASHSIIISNKSNLGQAKCRKIGINQAHGKYIIACDSDDFVSLDAYEELFNFIESTNSDIVACDYYHIYQNKYNITQYKGADSPNDWIKNILLSYKLSALWCHMIKKDLLSNILYPECNLMEDAVILSQCLLKSTKVSTYGKPLYYYNFRENSISNNPHKVLEQAQQMRVNLDYLSPLLLSVDSSFKRYIECKHFFIKRWIFPIIKTSIDCNFWIKFDSKINRSLFFNSFISVKDKIAVILIFLRIYPYIKKFLR